MEAMNLNRTLKSIIPAQPQLFFRSHDGTPQGRYVDDKPHKLVVWIARE